MTKLIGRKSEKAKLIVALKSNRPELIVVYGRRRIGKTFLVREVYKKHIIFEFSGIHKASLPDQLTKFHLLLSEKLPTAKKPSSWIEAFYLLSQYLNKKTSKKKKVIFIDEFPWLDTRKSKFLPAFDDFWNSFVTKRKDIVVVVCGSAASYMINNIIKNKGGLHNRLTDIIQLLPFNLYETERMLISNGVKKLSRYDILQIFMAMGGVPHYLEKILPGESVPQIVDRLCFEKDGFLQSEFDNVFASLFDQHDNHDKIIRILASVRKGFTRNDILAKSKITSGGRLSKTLTELEESGFIEKYTPYKGTRNSMIRLTDQYSMFYIKYIENTKPVVGGYWMKLQTQQSYKIWSGFSFETICMNHIEQIKAGLKISGIISTHGSWTERNSTNNAQIDLVIDRDDNVISLCEMKFYNSEFTINKKYASEIANKINAFTLKTKTRKSIFVTFITSYGLVTNSYSNQYVQNELTIEHLFADL
jgi:uncharacterized protein